MMSYEELDAIQLYDYRSGKDETVMPSVVRDTQPG